VCAGQRALLTMLGVKGSQVQILSARQNVAGDLRKRRSPFVAQGRPPRIPRLERRRVALAAARTCTCAGWRCGECARSCDAAWTEVARPEDGPDGLADSCTPSYIGMEAAACWGALRRTGAHWGASMLPSPPTSAACKHGPTDCAGTRACAWRLANAYAGRDDVERACRAGRQAVDVIRAATSSRALSEVQRVRVRLAPWRRHAEVSELGDRIRGLLYPAG
jgi:hypothetical protein